MKIVNLYPPIINTYIPSFVITDDSICRVYFSLSKYNDLNADISKSLTQVTVSNQYTNLSALTTKLYPCGIKLTELKEDTAKNSDDKYYIEIKNSDIEDGFQINTYYKVQIRLTNISVKSPTYSTEEEDSEEYEVQSIDKWLYDNLDYFSEWSTVCLIRGISQPILQMTGLNAEEEYSSWHSSNFNLAGKLVFLDSTETDTLKSYQVKLYDESYNLLTNSGVIYSNNFNDINEINYTFSYAFLESQYYVIELSILTRNLYEQKNSYKIFVVSNILDKLNANITATADNTNGRIAIHIFENTNQIFNTNITIRRTSNKSNFLEWEDVHTTYISTDSLNYTWYDYTIESGIWYKYSVQKRDKNGNRGALIEIEDAVMSVFQDIFLVADEKQLIIKYNPSISSFKRVISETKTDTIGNQYPIVRRNGSISYTQFPISGLISYLSDEDNIFISKEELFDKKGLPLYEEYNTDSNISFYDDNIYERKFRDKVIDFLYTNNIKLFKSATEGNFLVKLMEISLTPETTLGRHIYSFSCTAYEIAESTLSNCDFYNVQKIGTYNTDIPNTVCGVDCYYKGILKKDENLLDLIKDQNLLDKHLDDNYILDYLQSFSITMLGKESIILEKNNEPYITTGNIVDLPSNNAFLGYILIINDQKIVIGAEKKYEIEDFEDMKITSITVPIDSEIKIRCSACFIEKEPEVIKEPIKIEYIDTIGQIYGKFTYEDLIYNIIIKKYNDKQEKYKKELLYINNVKIEAEKGTVVYIKTSNNNNFKQYIIDKDILDFSNTDYTIRGVYFFGLHLMKYSQEEIDNDTDIEGYYIDTGISADTFEDINEPIENGVYTINSLVLKVKAIDELQNLIYISNQEILQDNEDFILLLKREIDSTNRYIWHNNQWYLFTNDNNILCTIESKIDYFAKIKKEYYEI